MSDLTTTIEHSNDGKCVSVLRQDGNAFLSLEVTGTRVAITLYADETNESSIAAATTFDRDVLFKALVGWLAANTFGS